MKNMKMLFVFAVVLICLSGCHKTNGSGSSGAPISADADAKAVFIKINSLYVSVLRPLLVKNKQTFTNFVLYDSAGQKMVANGQYSTTSYSGSSGSTSSSTIDVTVSFQQYSYGGLTLNGNVRFFDWYSTRTDCGSSGCATSTHKDLAYSTADTTAATAVAIKLSGNGAVISDNISLKSSKEYSTFSVTLWNGARKKYAFYY